MSGKIFNSHSEIMKLKSPFILLLILILTISCRHKPASSVNNASSDTASFPDEVTRFKAWKNNPVFKGTGSDTWDHKIRERGYILLEDGIYYLWYTGYRGDENSEKHLGLATSTDGLSWTRYKDNPIHSSGWVEDMCVLKHDSTYYMFAEGRGDTAHLLTSTDRIHWEEKGPLEIRYADGRPLSKGPYGTPAVYFENGIFYLFYERDDKAIWLATSTDMKVWTNKQDDPVVPAGPEAYDRAGVAMNQIIKYKGKYYGYYHATEFADWSEWTSCVVMSEDLIHWKKYPHNPIMRENKSSPLIVDDGQQLRLYTMHPEVCVHFPQK
jgi:beta-1,2-mannobiose phosphorylase / 1,2-beta-oligomannan phosphorylase